MNIMFQKIGQTSVDWFSLAIRLKESIGVHPHELFSERKVKINGLSLSKYVRACDVYDVDHPELVSLVAMFIADEDNLTMLGEHVILTSMRRQYTLGMMNRNLREWRDLVMRFCHNQINKELRCIGSAIYKMLDTQGYSELFLDCTFNKQADGTLEIR